MAREGKNGAHAIVESSAAVVTDVSRSLACWLGRHSSHRARSWDPVTVPHPVALWNRACGGQAGLNTWVELRSARPVPMIVPIAAPLRIRRLILMPFPALPAGPMGCVVGGAAGAGGGPRWRPARHPPG